MKSYVVATALFLSAATSAHSADQALIDAAVKEGKVSWYVSLIQDQAARPLSAAFEAKYQGVKVEIVGGKTSDLLLRVMDELKVNRLVADVAHSATAQATIPSDQLAEFIPDPAGDYPDDMKDPKGRWTAQVINYLVPAYNTDLVKNADAPTTYEDLLKPEWKGQIAWPVSLTPGGPPGFIGTVLKVMGEEKGMVYLTTLSQQKIVNVPANQRTLLDQVIVGQYPMAICTYSHHSDISAAEGAPVKWIALQPLVTSTIDPVFVLKNAPHPNAARLLVDFIVSDEGQNVLLKAGYIPANPKLRKAGSNPPAHTLTPEEVATGLGDWIKIYDKLFK